MIVSRRWLAPGAAAVAKVEVEPRGRLFGAANLDFERFLQRHRSGRYQLADRRLRRLEIANATAHHQCNEDPCAHAADMIARIPTASRNVSRCRRLFDRDE